LRSLPSSSSLSANIPSNAAVFGEALVDMIWTVDAELDEVLADAKTALATCDEQGNAATGSAAAVPNKSRKTKQDAEKDKDSIQFIVKKLLVRCVVNYSSCLIKFPNRTLEY
jgi:THO complex subunit 2